LAPHPEGLCLTTDDGAQWVAQRVVNAAGHGAPALAATWPQWPEGLHEQAYYAKGQYFSCSGKTPFQHLIYPIPEQAGLGVHLTLDLAGQAKFGPDVQWVSDPHDYSVDAAQADRFYEQIQRYWPGLPAGSLQPAYAGVRPKLSGPGQSARDFVLYGPANHGIDGMVHLMGIESPGLTSCLAIAEAVAHALT
jgi:L-2-hydroxyglutarate oxidase LhgO